MTTARGKTAATNRLLARLPDPDRRRLLGKSIAVQLSATDVLYERGKRIREVYFPTGGSVSLIAALHGHDKLQVGLVGDEGMLGTSLVLGLSLIHISEPTRPY